MTPYKKYLALLKALEGKYYPQILNATNLVYSSFKRDLQTSGIDAARNNLQQLTASDSLLNIILDIYRDAGVKGARLTLTELRASIKGERKSLGFGQNAEWIQAVLNYLRFHALQFAQFITETIREDILKVLAKAVEEGWSVDRILDELDESGLPRARARVIVRTELVRAANVGHAEGAKAFPFEVNKKWIAGRDHRVRHSHRFVNNNLIDEYGYFDVPVYKGKTKIGTEQMLYPGDAKASAANTINCRCRIVHEPKRDADGNLIRRSTTSATVIPMRRVTTEIPAAGIAALKKALSKSVFIGVNPD